MIDLCEFIKVEDDLPKDYSLVTFLKVADDGNYKAYKGSYHNGFWWCGCLKDNVDLWKYRCANEK